MVMINSGPKTISEQEFEQLIDQNMGLIVHIVKSMRPPNATEYEEYIQLGKIGLWKAYREHDANLSKLSTRAWSYIRWEIIRYINKSNKYKCLLRNPDAIYRCELVARERMSSNISELEELLPNTLSRPERIAVNMRNQGYTFQEIGTELGYTKMWANKLFKSALQKIKDVN